MPHDFYYHDAPAYDAEMAAIVEADDYDPVATGELEYSLRIVTAFCEACDRTDKGTAMQLERRGWTFHKGTQWCVWHSI